MKTRPSERIARLILRLRVVLVVGWLAAAVACVSFLPTLEEAQSGALGDLVPSDADAIDAEIRSHELFGFPLLSRNLLVQRNPRGLGTEANARVYARAAALNAERYPGLTGIAGALAVTSVAEPIARERGTTAITYLFFPQDIGPVGRDGLTDRLIERHTAADDAVVGATGAIAARRAQADAVESGLPLVELMTVILVALAVGLHFRAIGAPIATLAAVAVSYLCAIRSIAWIGQKVGVSVPIEVEPVVVVLLFGVITDYSIFFLSRFRRMLGDGLGQQVAAERATAELLPIIVTAGVAIAAASASLGAARVGFLQAFGPGMAMSVLVGVVVAVTLIPALIGLFGAKLLWPGKRLEPGPAKPDRARLVGLAVRRPAITTLVCTAALCAAASGLIGLKVGNPLIRGLPEDAPARVAYEAATQGLVPGILSPTVVVVEGEGITSRRAELATLQRRIARLRDVAAVAGPANNPSRLAFGGVLSETGDAARYVVVFGSDPLGGRAIAAERRLDRRLPRALDRLGLENATVAIAGDTALVRETVDQTFDDILRVAPLTILLLLIVMGLFLRAVVAPLYLIAASLLALLAALGLTAYVFEDLLGYGELTYYVPFAAGVLLVALGSDYNVFVIGRIWREAEDRPLGDAVLAGASRAAGPIAVAGVILAASFALLALVELRPFREIAFMVSVGLLIDAFIVRTLLIPALVLLVGERSSWPGTLRKLRTRSARG